MPLTVAISKAFLKATLLLSSTNLDFLPSALHPFSHGSLGRIRCFHAEEVRRSGLERLSWGDVTAEVTHLNKIGAGEQLFLGAVKKIVDAAVPALQSVAVRKVRGRQGKALC